MQKSNEKWNEDKYIIHSLKTTEYTKAVFQENQLGTGRELSCCCLMKGKQPAEPIKARFPYLQLGAKLHFQTYPL